MTHRERRLARADRSGGGALGNMEPGEDGGPQVYLIVAQVGCGGDDRAGFPVAVAWTREAADEVVDRLGEWIDEVMEAYGDWYRGDEHVFPEGTGARARTNHYRLDCGSHCTVPRRSVYRKWCRLEPGKYGYDVKNLPMPPVGAWDWEALENHDLRGYGDHQEGLRLLVQEIPMAGEVGGGGHE